MTPLQKLLQKPMTRKQFLLTMLGGLTSVFGLTSLLGLLAKETKATNSELPGYGKQNYGP